MSLQVILAVPYFVNLPQGDSFLCYGGHQIECAGRTPENLKRNLTPVFPVLELCFVGDQARAVVCPTITLQYQHSGNFFAVRGTFIQIQVHASVIKAGLSSYAGIQFIRLLTSIPS
jgi:hypothetical protein